MPWRTSTVETARARFVMEADFERRIVSGDSTLRWKCRKVFVSSLLKYHTVGLEQIADQVWSSTSDPSTSAGSMRPTTASWTSRNALRELADL